MKLSKHQMIIILIIKTLSFPVYFHLYADDYIISIQNLNPKYSNIKYEILKSQEKWKKGIRHFGPFFADYGDQFEVILFNVEHLCLYGIGGYMDVDGYKISTNSDKDLSLWKCRNCTNQNECNGTHNNLDAEGYRIFGFGDKNDIQFNYSFIIYIPQNFEEIKQKLDEKFDYEIQYTSDNFTEELFLGEEREICLSKHINMLLINHFLVSIGNSNTLGNDQNFKYT